MIELILIASSVLGYRFYLRDKRYMLINRHHRDMFNMMMNEDNWTITSINFNTYQVSFEPLNRGFSVRIDKKKFIKQFENTFGDIFNKFFRRYIATQVYYLLFEKSKLTSLHESVENRTIDQLIEYWSNEKIKLNEIND